jgi:hypothetical protein
MATSFGGGGNRSTRREPPTMGKQLVNFITWREYLLKKIQYTDVIDAITEIKKEMYNMCEKEKISL